VWGLKQPVVKSMRASIDRPLLTVKQAGVSISTYFKGAVCYYPGKRKARHNPGFSLQNCFVSLKAFQL
jgi:hypothetical protein